ncbi:MAG: DUF3109 family protein [Bacteroidetes bacterium]|nr:DUF3109 family protein [Bacteroidota bacterium]
MPCPLRIDETIISTRFACDLSACKGACCTFPGGSGAPVSLEEIPILKEAWKAVHDMLPAEHRREGETLGLFVRDGEDMTLRCYDDRACVFVMYEGPVALCSIQKLHQEAGFSWPKPLSCHLFPIRIRRRGSAAQLRLQHFRECEPGYAAGEELDVNLVDFLEVPLKRAFGGGVFTELKERSDARNNGEPRR